MVCCSQRPAARGNPVRHDRHHRGTASDGRSRRRRGRDDPKSPRMEGPPGAQVRVELPPRVCTQSDGGGAPPIHHGHHGRRAAADGCDIEKVRARHRHDHQPRLADRRQLSSIAVGGPAPPLSARRPSRHCPSCVRVVVGWRWRPKLTRSLCPLFLSPLPILTTCVYSLVETVGCGGGGGGERPMPCVPGGPVAPVAHTLEVDK